MTIWMPTVQDVLYIHERQIERTGGTHGVRDMALIEMALDRALSSFGGVEAHVGVIQKAAAVCCGLTQNHGFVDGNKRVGILTMLLILRRNGIRLCYTQAELVELGFNIARSLSDVPDVALWIEAHHV